MTGIPTRRRYVGATIFVDQATRFAYAHLQTSLDGENTIAGKVKFEDKMQEMGYPVHHYHADNGIFAAKVWLAHVHSKGQTQSYAGVGAHHQNGVAE